MEIAIVGSGFSGLCMGIMLKKHGINSFKIYERANKLGGTWRDNNYPGAACDVSSHVYSFSFEPNPHWSRMFSAHDEILKYLEHCANKYDLNNHIVYNTSIEKAIFNQSNSKWEITANGNQTITADIYISAAGPLNRPTIPNFAGLEEFNGISFHSSEWRHDVDLTDKNVAIIGTGASAIQIVPEIASKVKSLTVFQRTAPWVIAKPDRKMLNIEKWFFSKLPFTQYLLRQYWYWRNEATAIGFIKNTNVLKFAERLGEHHINKQIKNKELREKVTPNFRMGCKRILMSNNYYPALSLPNVKVETNSIKNITYTGITTNNENNYDTDVIVFCTGFNAAEFPKEFTVIGKNGVNINEVWNNGPEAYLGTSVPGFPNMFFIIGPNTGLGHNSMVYMIEANVNYIVECIKHLKDKGFNTLNLKQEVFKSFNSDLQQKLKTTIWDTGCNAWYTLNNGKNTTLWPDFTFKYKKLTTNVNANDYEWE